MARIINFLFYFTYMILLFILSTKPKYKNNKKIVRFFLILMTIYFFCKELGLDYGVYKKWFYNLNLNHSYKIFKDNLEPLNYFLIYVLRYLDLSHRWFFLIIGFIPLYINYCLINLTIKNNKLLALFFLMYINFFTNYSDALRANVSASLLLLGLYWYKDIKYYCCLLLSFLCHYSAVMYVPVVLLRRIKWNKKQYIISLIISALIGVVCKNLITNITLDSISNNNMIWKLKYYLILENGIKQYLNILHYILSKLMNLLPLLGIQYLNYILLTSYEEVDDFSKRIIKMSIITTFIATTLYFMGATGFSNRILTYGTYGLYLVITNKVTGSKIKIFTLIYYFLVNIVIFLYYIGIHLPKSPFYLLN